VISHRSKFACLFTGNIRPSIDDILTSIDIQREIEKQKQELAQQAARANSMTGKHN